MAIIKKPTTTDNYINAAPDGAAKSVSTEQVQITLKLSSELLAKVDAAAKDLNISRAGFIKMSLSNAIK